MLDNKTQNLIKELEKTAASEESSTGVSQIKKRKQTTQRDFEGEGAGLGALLGAASGALSAKHKSIKALAGALGGALAGKELGKRTIGTSRNVTSEGVIKKQEKKPQGAEVPRLTDEKVLKLIEDTKK